MSIRYLWHGTNGDNILGIIRSGEMKPDAQNEIYVCDFEYDRRNLYSHGGDSRRKAAFVIKVEATIPSDVTQYRKPTPGVPNTLVLVTSNPVAVRVLEMYVRKPGLSGFEERGPIKGSIEITKYLSQ